MTQYYFLASSLPPLHFGAPPEISFEQLTTLLKENLSAGDLQQARILRGYYDILNIRAYWKGEPLDPHGNLNEVQLDEALIDQQGTPAYLNRFLEEYEDTPERIRHFPRLLAAYFRVEERRSSGFLHRFLKMERELRLILVGFRAKKLGRDLLKELQYENPEEEIVAQILAQKDDPDFHAPDPYQQLKPLFIEHENDPMGLHQDLLEWRFEKIQEMVGVEVFSLDRILGYTERLILLENWLELDRQKGNQLVDTIVKERA